MSELKLSDSDKLIVTMLCDIYVHLGIVGELDAEFIRKAIQTGNSWALASQYPGLLGVEDAPSEVVRETLDVLEMWTEIERAQKHEGDGPNGKASTKRFPGFDGNHELPYLNVTRFLIDDLDRFVLFQNRDLNSHMPMLARYRKGLGAFRDARSQPTYDGLSRSQLAALLDAMV